MRKSDPKKASERLALVESWRQSGLSLQAFSDLHQISHYTMRYWCKKSRKLSSQGPAVSSSPAFMPLKVKGSPGSGGSIFCELFTGNGRRLVLHRQMDARFLKVLLD